MSYTNRKGWFNLTDISLDERRALLQKALSEGNDSRIAEAYFLIGSEIEGESPEEALRCLRDSHQYAQKANYFRVLGLCSLNISQFAVDSGDIGEGIEMAREAIRHFSQTDDRYFEAGAIYQMGRFYQLAGDLSRAVELYQKSAIMFEKSDEPEGAAWSLTGLGIAAHDIGDTEGAIQYFESALPLALRMHDKSAAENTLHDLTSAFIELKNYDRAARYLEQAEKLAEDETYLGKDGFRLQLRGGVLRLRGDLQGAINAYVDAQKVFKSKNSVGEWMELIPELSTAYIEIGLPNEAEQLLEEGRHICNELDRRRQLVRILDLLSMVQRDRGEVEKAYLTIKEMIELRTTFFTEDYKSKTASMQRLLASERQREEIRVYQLRGEHLERELSNNTLALLAQTELLSDLRSDLLQIAKKIPPTEPAARELRERVKNLPCQSIDWEKFDTQFKAAHPDFVRNLTEKHPNLTAGDVRICSLVRMNLTSEEIARLFCLSERSVETHRFRIRKKINLPREMDLMIYLAKI